jgi:Zn-dependent peptidase ImmA (M78 family)
VPPADGLKWREQIAVSSGAPRLKDIAGDLWKRGIPVVPLDLLPSPGFQGIACVVDGRPTILLGYKYDEPGRAGFLIAHETGHIASGDCTPDVPVVDEEDEIADDGEIERRADLYATQLLVRNIKVPQVSDPGGRDYKELARRASEIERAAGADASAVIFSWARQTGDYATATMAVRALYRSSGARKELRRLFDAYVDVAAASETDQALLRCVHRDLTTNEAAGGH